VLRDTLQPIPQKQVDGILYLYDSTRSRWISVIREVVGFGINHKNIKSNRWLYLIGRVKSFNIGYRLPRDGIITAVTIQLSTTGSATFQIFKNSTTLLSSISLTSQTGLTQTGLNIYINKDDYIQCKVLPSPLISYPIVMVELCWG